MAVCLFAFTTLIGNYYYTEGCLRFIMKKEPGKGFMVVYRLLATALVFVGAIISAAQQIRGGEDLYLAAACSRRAVMLFSDKIRNSAPNTPDGT